MSLEGEGWHWKSEDLAVAPKQFLEEQIKITNQKPCDFPVLGVSFHISKMRFSDQVVFESFY